MDFSEKTSYLVLPLYEVIYQDLLLGISAVCNIRVGAGCKLPAVIGKNILYLHDLLSCKIDILIRYVGKLRKICSRQCGIPVFQFTCGNDITETCFMSAYRYDALGSVICEIRMLFDKDIKESYCLCSSADYGLARIVLIFAADLVLVIKYQSSASAASVIGNTILKVLDNHDQGLLPLRHFKVAL